MSRIRLFSLSLIIFFFVFLGNVYAQDRFYHLNLFYSKGELELKSLAVIPSENPQAFQEGEYRLELNSFNKELLHTNRFQITLLTHGEEIDPETGKFISKTLAQDSSEISLRIPYFPNGKEIDIYDPDNKKILTIPVAQFAEITPTPISPTPQYKITKLEKGISTPWIIGGGILFILFVSTGVFVYIRFKKPQNLLQ